MPAPIRRTAPGWLAVAVFLLAGCGSSADGAAPVGGADASPTRLPAEYAGGACQLLNYQVVESTLGARFDVAASAQQQDTYTCVLQPAKADYPDLLLSVTPTDADVSVFKSTVVPDGASRVSDLGLTGYSTLLKAGGGAGPGVEVGWLSGNSRLIVLRYTLASGAAAGDAKAAVPKLVALAKKVDQSSL
ncbi:MAG TPA: hypothetical protein VF054_11275 [Micromonosporaceae bacterium]